MLKLGTAVAMEERTERVRRNAVEEADGRLHLEGREIGSIEFSPSSGFVLCL